MALELQIRRVSELNTMSINGKERATMSSNGYAFSTQEKEAIPTDYEQVIEGDAGYFLSRVVVKAIPSSYGHIAFNGGVLMVY